MIVSTMIAPDINEFPDSGTLWARSFAPGSVPPDDGGASRSASWATRSIRWPAAY